MKSFSFFRSKISFFILVFLVFLITSEEITTSNPSFYLASDKSFGEKEVPYVNLEGPLNSGYEFRVYKIENPEDFLIKNVKSRKVTEGNNKAFGNPVDIFKYTLNVFKQDYRNVARKEFNLKTRSHLKRVSGVDFNQYYDTSKIALPSVLKGHKLVLTFNIKKAGLEWSYKRVPIPVSDNGVYLVEAVSGSNLAHTVIVKSGINFISKQSDDQTVLYVAHRSTGKPVKNCNVFLYDQYNLKKIFSNKTDEKGIVAYNGKTPEKSLIVVSGNGSYAISDPDFYSKSFYGEGGIRSYIYTDRPVYRPGDEVNFKGIIRSFARGRYMPVGGDATYNIFTENNDAVISDEKININSATGTVNGKFNLPNDRNIYLGIYYLVINYRGKNYSTEFSVQAYKKPPFYVTVKSNKKTYSKNDTINISINGKYFHGDDLSEGLFNCKVFRKLKYDYSPVGALPFFLNVNDYLGLDGSNVKKDLVIEKSGKLDSEGNFSFSFKPENIDDDYSYSAVVSVTADDFTLSGAASFSVNRSLFFIRTKKNKSVFNPGDNIFLDVSLIPYDQRKSKTIDKRKIKAFLYKRAFVNISQEGEREKIADDSKVTDSSGNCKFKFELEKSGHYILELQAKDPNGDETTGTTAFWVSGKNDSIQVPFKNLTLKTDKDIYSVGDVADILIMSPVADGNFFLSLESGKIHSYETLQFKGNSYKKQVKITADMAPNFTLSVTQFNSNDIYKSEIKIVVPPQDKFIKVDIKPGKKIYKPGETAVLEINTKSLTGHSIASELSVSVVDEAIYQIEEDKNPEITTYFYHPRRNNVNSALSDAFRFFGYSEAKRLQLALNSKENMPLAAIKDSKVKSRERFKDTCYWSAVVKTNSSGKAVVKVPLADNLTTWRVTVVAVTKDTKVGIGKNKFLARKDLMVRGILPSFILRGEKQTVGAVITNSSKKDLNIKTTIKVKNGKVIGQKDKRIMVKKGGTKPLYFEVEPDKNSKELFVDIQAIGGKFSDRFNRAVVLKSKGIMVNRVESVKLDSGDDNKKKTFDLDGSFSEGQLEITFNQGGEEALKQSLYYLVGYPYGCIEQTMSRFMPLLSLKKSGITDPLLNKDLDAFVMEGLSKINQHQNTDGGFGWFGESRSDVLMSAYVYRGLSVCKKLFKKVDSKTITKAKKFLYQSLSSGRLNDFEKAYLLFSLSEDSKIEKSILFKLKEKNLTVYSKALLSAALYNNNYKSEAEELFSESLNDSGFKGENEKLFDEKSKNWQDDQVETASVLLSMALKLNRSESVINDLTDLLLYNRKGYAWKNSRDTAMAVLAIAEKLAKYKKSIEKSGFIVKVNGVEKQKLTISPETISNRLNTINIGNPQFKSGKNTVELIKEDGAEYYCSIMFKYFSEKEKYEPYNNGIDLKRTYYKVDVEEVSNGLKLNTSQDAEFKTGDLIMVEIEYNIKDQVGNYVMIEDSLVPGFQAELNDREYYSSDRKMEYSYKQFYDDRVVFFVNGPSSSGTILYFLRAGIPGKYMALPAMGSLMYYPGTNGASSDNSIEIKSSQEN